MSEMSVSSAEAFSESGAEELEYSAEVPAETEPVLAEAGTGPEMEASAEKENAEPDGLALVMERFGGEAEDWQKEDFAGPETYFLDGEIFYADGRSLTEEVREGGNEFAIARHEEMLSALESKDPYVFDGTLENVQYGMVASVDEEGRLAYENFSHKIEEKKTEEESCAEEDASAETFPDQPDESGAISPEPLWISLNEVLDTGDEFSEAVAETRVEEPAVGGEEAVSDNSVSAEAIEVIEAEKEPENRATAAAAEEETTASASGEKELPIPPAKSSERGPGERVVSEDAAPVETAAVRTAPPETAPEPAKSGFQESAKTPEARGAQVKTVDTKIPEPKEVSDLRQAQKGQEENEPQAKIAEVKNLNGPEEHPEISESSAAQAEPARVENEKLAEIRTVPAGDAADNPPSIGIRQSAEVSSASSTEKNVVAENRKVEAAPISELPVKTEPPAYREEEPAEYAPALKDEAAAKLVESPKENYLASPIASQAAHSPAEKSPAIAEVQASRTEIKEIAPVSRPEEKPDAVSEVKLTTEKKDGEYESKAKDAAYSPEPVFAAKEEPRLTAEVRAKSASREEIAQSSAPGPETKNHIDEPANHSPEVRAEVRRHAVPEEREEAPRVKPTEAQEKIALDETPGRGLAMHETKPEMREPARSAPAPGPELILRFLGVPERKLASEMPALHKNASSAYVSAPADETENRLRERDELNGITLVRAA